MRFDTLRLKELTGCGILKSALNNKLLEYSEKGEFSWQKFQMKVITSSAAVIFGMAVLILSFLAISNPAVVHPSSGTAISPTPTVQATTAAMIKMEYYLPYPGVLPDSPLYKIKALRDRLELWMTFDEGEKAKRELTFADKRINAAIFLMQGGKGTLAVSTATKAEKYLESAVGRTVKKSNEGTDVKSLLMEMGKSAAKHLEVLENMKDKVKGDELKALEAAEKTTQYNLQRVQQALLEAK